MPKKHLFAVLLIILSIVPKGAYAVSLKHDFEDATNASVIADSLKGLAFSVEDGDWYYGDVRAGGYDAPYPYGAYAVDGHGFAWTAKSLGDARIDFTAGTATFFAADFSTQYSLVISGYDSDDQVVDSAAVRPNINTGKLTSIRLEATVEQGLAYIIIQGTQNRWLMDNLETDAPLPIEPEIIEKPKTIAPAFVTVSQRATPNTSVQAGEVVVYELVTTNRGHGSASNVQISLPFDASEVKILDASFSRPTAWVSSLGANKLQVDTGGLGSGGDVITATIRLQVLEALPLGTALGERSSFRWSDKAQGGTGSSNTPQVVVGEVSANNATYALDVEQTEQSVIISSSAFIPKEPVALWYDTPEGKSISLGLVVADNNGSIKSTLSSEQFSSGLYQLVAYGQWSAITASNNIESQVVTIN
jgi:hypothetical protein